MTGTTEGGKKAAETRGRDELAEAGRKGGEHPHGGSKASSSTKNRSTQEKGSNLSQEDRSKGGQHSHSGSRKEDK